MISDDWITKPCTWKNYWNLFLFFITAFYLKRPGFEAWKGALEGAVFIAVIPTNALISEGTTLKSKISDTLKSDSVDITK